MMECLLSLSMDQMWTSITASSVDVDHAMLALRPVVCYRAVLHDV